MPCGAKNQGSVPASHQGRARRFLALLILLTALGPGRPLPTAAIGAPEVPAMIEESFQLEKAGRLAEAEARLDGMLSDPGVSLHQRHALEAERERLRRVRLDYPLSRVQVLDAFRESLRDFNLEEFERWLAEGLLDVRRLDGEERFFVSAVSNLYFRRPALEARRREPREWSKLLSACTDNARAIRAAAQAESRVRVLPKRFRVRMEVTTLPGVTRGGDEVRAWIPFPRSIPRQTDLVLRHTLPPEHRVGAPESLARAIRLETRATSSEPVHFAAEYEYTSYGVWHDLDAGRSLPVRTGGDSAGTAHLGEEPHVEFSPAMREWAARLGGNETNPVLRARRFYEGIADSIQYRFAPEYGTLRNLGAMCLAEKRGDCGQATFLFMTLCRLSGIPARWQSGWTLFPGDQTLHDWCEIRLEPWGWVPVDPYMAVRASQYAAALDPERRRELKDFYFGGMSQYRLVVNGAHQCELDPPKPGGRADPVDFQRGEVEVGGRTLFFDGFDYRLNWEEIPLADAAAP